jgi:hypothetical protein
MGVCNVAVPPDFERGNCYHKVRVFLFTRHSTSLYAAKERERERIKKKAILMFNTKLLNS